MHVISFKLNLLSEQHTQYICFWFFWIKKVSDNGGPDDLCVQLDSVTSVRLQVGSD